MTIYIYLKIGKTKVYFLGSHTLFGKAIRKRREFLCQNDGYLFRRWRLVAYAWDIWQGVSVVLAVFCFLTSVWLHEYSLYNYSLNCTCVWSTVFCSYDIFHLHKDSSENDLWWWSAAGQRKAPSRFFAKVLA